MRRRAAVESDAYDMRRAMHQQIGSRSKRRRQVAEPDEAIERYRRHQTVVSNGVAVVEMGHVRGCIQPRERLTVTKARATLRLQSHGKRPPDGARPATLRESEPVVRPPRDVV